MSLGSTMSGDEPKNVIQMKLLALINRTGYPIVQHNGQRHFGPPPDWKGPPPPRGCEVFIGKLHREVFEDELVPIFSSVGKIYEMRLMMDFSGSNRGYAFVTYTNRADAYTAIRELNGYEIRPGRRIGVVKSVDNCRLFVGSVPKTKTKEEVLEELSKFVTGIVDVILYKNLYDKRTNRGFAFVEFESHRAAAMARRSLIPGTVKLWDQDVNVDWAEPEPDVDDELMKKVKILYARNFQIKTTPDTIQSIFESAIGNKVERVKKMYDYAFIHFYTRKHAELAMAKLQNKEIDGSTIEIRWAKPVERELYRIQKLKRGNAKFNNNCFDLTQTLLLYKQHLDQREYAKSSKEDEGIGSACGSPETKIFPPVNNYYLLAPARLDAMCKRFMWASPMYSFSRYFEGGAEMWVCTIELPQIGVPVVSRVGRVGPLSSRPCSTIQQAQIEVAEAALGHIKMLQAETIKQSTAYTVPQTMYPAMTHSHPTTCINHYDYTHLYRTPPPPVALPTLPTIWRTA